MVGYGLAHWVMMLLILIVIVYPVGRILARLGFTPLLSLLALVPLVNLLGLWVLAFVEWPKRRSTSANGSTPT